MKKQKNKLGKYEKGLIITGIVVAIIFLILITADGIKNKDKNNTPIGLSEQGENITNTPNAPTMSAGMIPVKYEGDNLIISKNDNNWYNYAQGKPAYMMLNDGVYQSELVVDMTGKKLASGNIGQVVEKEEQGSIYMWIPRYAIDEETEEIVYVEQEQMIGGKYNQPEVFSYIVADETKPDFSLAGIWIEKTPLTSANEVTTKIANINKEENIYGLIANTVGVDARDCPMTAEPWSTGTVPDGIVDPSNTNRTILKIIDTGKPEPIKAKAIYNWEIGQVEIQVTYNKNKIAKIIDEEGNILNENSLTANTGDKEFENKKIYTYTVIDKEGNKIKVKCKINKPMLAKDITKEDYGKRVKNYICQNTGVSTWRVFHVSNNNLYLIADDYIPYANLPTSTDGRTKPNGSNYRAYFTAILSDYTGSAWIINNTNVYAQKWVSWWVDKYPKSTSTSIKSVAYMMDTDSWSGFAGENAEYVIAGPTIELFCASYGVTHSDRSIAIAINNYGYLIKWNGSSSQFATGISGLIKDDYNGIYIKSDRSKALGMWIAAPAGAMVNSFVMYADYNGNISSGSYDKSDLGFRPVVCLKSNTAFLDNGDGTFSIM